MRIVKWIESNPFFVSLTLTLAGILSLGTALYCVNWDETPPASPRITREDTSETIAKKVDAWKSSLDLYERKPKPSPPLLAPLVAPLFVFGVIGTLVGMICVGTTLDDFIKYHN